jgi:hypothetical protein
MRAEYDFRRAKRGAIDPLPPGKTRITIRLDDEILRWFKDLVNAAGGGNYQTLINHALREHIHRQREPFEETLRRVLREEFPRLRAVSPKRLKRAAEKRGRLAVGR